MTNARAPRTGPGPRPPYRPGTPLASGERDRAGGERHPLRSGNPAHAKVELEIAAQPLGLPRDLIEQRAADQARADQADRNGVRRQIETRVHGAQRTGAAAAVDDHRDVSFRGTLGDRPHVHRRGAEGLEHLGGDAVRARHAVADHCENAAAAIDLDALDLALPQLRVERATHDPFGALCLRLRHSEADRVLRAALGDQDHGDAVLAQRPEEPMCRAGDADHAGALEIGERDPVDGRDALHERVWCDLTANHRPRPFGSKGVADPDRDPLADRGRHGLRMDDLGAEIRELHGLVVRQGIDDRRFGHEPRIGRQHAVDVGPDHDLRRVEQRAEDRRGEVAAVTPEGGLQTLRVGRDETRDDERALELRRDRREQIGARTVPSGRRARAAPTPPAAPCRASSHCVLPWTRPRASNSRVKTCVDQISPYPATRSRMVVDAARTRRTVCRMPAMSWQSCSRPVTNSSQASEGSNSRASCTWRTRSSSRRWSSAGSCRSAMPTRLSSASVTPRHADSTTALRRAVSSSMIEATRRMHTASATLEPPNLWTFQASKPLTL